MLMKSGVLLQKFPVSKVLGANIFLWGIVTACTSSVKNGTQLIAMRAVLGSLESVITPALIMLTSAWYKKDESAPRFGFWYRYVCFRCIAFAIADLLDSGLGLGQILGGLISFAAQHSTNTSFSGWRVMFVCVGALNLIVAGVIFFWLPSTPEEASFINAAEQEVIARRLLSDHAGVGVKVVRIRSVFETFLDLQTWLLCILTILNVIPSGVITTYSSILIKSFGFTSKEAALLNMPSGIVSIVALMGSTYIITKGYQRWFAIICALLVTLLGACLMCFAPKNNHAALLIGIYLVNAVRLAKKTFSSGNQGSRTILRLLHPMPSSWPPRELTTVATHERSVSASPLLYVPCTICCLHRQHNPPREPRFMMHILTI
jgi:hypothetical protein